VALTSVLSVGLPPIIKSLQPKESDIKYTLVETELPDTITVFASNIGGGFGAVGKLAIYGPTKSKEYKAGKIKLEDLPVIYLEPDKGPVVIESDRTKLITYKKINPEAIL